MHIVLLCTIIFLGWQAVNGHAFQLYEESLLSSSSASTSMTLNSTISIANISRTVEARVYNPATHRAFFATYEDQSRLLEVSLPPVGDMSYVGSIPINTSYVMYAVLDSVISYPPVIYLCSPTNKVIQKYTIDYPASSFPSANATLPASSVTFVSSMTIPKYVDLVDSFMVAESYLYLSGLLTSGQGFIMRIPFSNFTEAFWVDPANAPILLGSDSNPTRLMVATADSSYVYYGSTYTVGGDVGNPSYGVYRVNTSSFSLVDPSPLSLVNVTSSLYGAFADPDRDLVYFFTQLSPISLVRVHTGGSTFQQTGTVVFEQNTKKPQAVHDVYGGHAYFGQFTSPAIITHINLQSFQVQPALYMKAPLAELNTGLIDAEHSWAYFSTYSDNFTIVKIQLPPPCAGLGNNFNDNCSYPYGYCQYATCHCFPNVGYEGPTCSSKTCINDCHRDASNNTDGIPHGTCNNGTCVCTSIYTGSDCSTRQCKNACQAHGTCGGPLSYQCQCFLDWYGDDCSQYIAIPSCDRLLSCDKCGTNTTCGWCSSTDTCMEGDSFGPYNHLCERYSFQECPSTFYFSFAYVLTAICWLFILLSAILTIFQDMTIPDNTKTRMFVVRFWWRNQLAAKTWQMVEYIQILAITGYLSVDMPPLYSEFILPFQWSILHLPYLFSHSNSIPRSPPSRDLLTFFEQGRVVHSSPHELFFGTLFYFALIVVALLSFFAVLFLVALCVGKSISTKLTSMVRSRVRYALLRAFLFAYFPLLVTAFFTLLLYSREHSYHYYPSSSFKIAVAFSALVLVGIGLGVPIFTFLVLHNKTKELFSVAFSMKYGALYQSYHFKKSFFITIRIGKSLLLSLWVGLLYDHDNSVPQLLLLSITHLVYFFITLVMKPFTDHIHYFTTLVVSLLEAALFLLFLGFRNHDHITVEGFAVGAVIVHILALSVIVVGIGSTIFKMNGITSLSELWATIRCTDKEEPEMMMRRSFKDETVLSSST